MISYLRANVRCVDTWKDQDSLGIRFRFLDGLWTEFTFDLFLALWDRNPANSRVCCQLLAEIHRAAGISKLYDTVQLHGSEFAATVQYDPARGYIGIQRIMDFTPAYKADTCPA